MSCLKIQDGRQAIGCVTVLCFSLRKYGKYPIQMLKSMLIDFYDVDLLISKPPNIPSKRSGNDVKEVDDVFALITHLDESRMFSSLPVYVSDDPDGMPSSQLYEGDLRGLMAHLSKLYQKVAIFDEKLNSAVQHLHMYTSSWPSPGAEPGPSARSAMSAQLRMLHSRDKQQAASVDWASTVDELNESVHSDDDVDSEPWQVQRSKRRRRSKS